LLIVQKQNKELRARTKAQREALQGGCCGTHALALSLKELLSAGESLRVRSVKGPATAFFGLG